MLTNSLPEGARSYAPVDRNAKRPARMHRLLATDQLPRSGGNGQEQSEPDWPFNRAAGDVVDPVVEISPSDIVRRRTVTCPGMVAELVQPTTHDRIEYRFRAPVHLLAVYERGVRRTGDTFVEGLPRSALRDLTRKFTFVPAGHEYYDLQEPRILPRILHFYLDPAQMPARSELGFGAADAAPRLFFEDARLWDTALKLMTLIEGSTPYNRLYLEALSVVLAHEVAHFNIEMPCIQRRVGGGLAAWQVRIVRAYIEEHLGEQISLARLAQLVRLSPFHFCRAFKQSFQMPPHQYHTWRRIERAKILLAKPKTSVTEIGFTVGFSQTGSFSAAFRKATGFTPTDYRRNFA